MVFRAASWLWVIPASLGAIGGWIVGGSDSPRASIAGRPSERPAATFRVDRSAGPMGAVKGVLPSGFVENCGQFEKSVRFALQRNGMSVFFTEDALVYVLQEGGAAPRPAATADTVQKPPDRGAQVVKMELLGASEEVELEGHGAIDARTSYFRGSPERWVSSAPSFARIRYREVLPSIDLVYSLDQGKLKSEWIVRPGGKVEDIRWRYEGSSKLEIVDGALQIETPAGVLEEEPPWLYQGSLESPLEIEGRYVLGADDTVGFEVGAYDATRALHIDPSLEWSTFIGGMWSETVMDLEVDSAGDVYVTGWTWSPDFPLTFGAFDTSFNGGVSDGFVSKIDGGTGALLWSTFLGGRRWEYATALGVDSSGAVYVTGWTESPDFPVTSGAFDTTLNGSDDVFVTKLDPSGSSLLFSTFLGGAVGDYGRVLVVDDAGFAYVSGSTSSTDFPTTSGAHDRSLSSGDVFVTKLDPAGASLVYSTFIGGSDDEFPLAIELDCEGNAYLTGWTESVDYPVTEGAFDTTLGSFEDAFVTKLDATGSTLVWSTFLGGDVLYDRGYALSVDDGGSVLVGGLTVSSDFPTTPGAFDRLQQKQEGFLTKFDPSGSSLVFSTLLGGVGNDWINSVFEDGTGIVCAGGTLSRDFPITFGSFDSELEVGDLSDAFVARIYRDGTGLIYSTYLGGTDSDSVEVAGGKGPEVFVAGKTFSPDFPLTPGAFDSTFASSDEAFITRLRLGPVLAFEGTPSAGSPARFVVSSAPSLETGALAQVALSCSGTAGIPLPGGQTLPLTFDACTSLSLTFGALLRGTIDAAGQATTPIVLFPPAAPGLKVYCAAFTYPSGGLVHSVTPPIEIVTQ